MGETITNELGSTTEFDMTLPGSVTEEQQAFAKYIPEEHHRDAWYANLSGKASPFSEFVKDYVNKDSLVGKKANGLTVPGENASAEEISAFRKATGVPDSFEGYEYSLPELGEEDKYLEEILKEQRSDDFVKQLKEIAFKSGVSSAAWKEMSKAFDDVFLRQLKSGVADEMQKLETRLKETQDSFVKQFGAKSDEVKNRMSSFLSGQPDYVKNALGDLTPAQITGLAALFNDIHTKYISEDTVNIPKTTRGAMPASEQDYATEIRNLYREQAKHQPFTSEYREYQRKIMELQKYFDDNLAKRG